MKADVKLAREAQRLGFEFVRSARHGDLWRHRATGRIVALSRGSNLGGASRGRQNQLAALRRAAASYGN